MLIWIGIVLDEILNTAGALDNLSEYVMKLLACMEYDTSYTVNAILDLLKLKSKGTFRKNHLGPAIEKA